MKHIHPNITKSNGFTIMELLVVLVILSLVTTLLLSSLSVIWKSFERLEHKQLNHSANLAAFWFRSSIENAIQFHPERPSFYGDARSITFFSVGAIDSETSQPTRLSWEILVAEDKHNQDIYTLRYVNRLSGEYVDTHKTDVPLSFVYANENKEQSSIFRPERSVLPNAVYITANTESENQIWVVAIPKNRGPAEVPVEMATFGEYEF
ncbi:prepilin-type N-terminal cleavage/methylation domain-containing protein [Agaribacter flavus]|uniref:Prepilin-type N-terminal cleavage/methylation domain-containing protein n=1 Tax=Agaribacter flavus TaxID=1902781 RepID=A0ABV7FRM0_9ALTE